MYCVNDACTWDLDTLHTNRVKAFVAEHEAWVQGCYAVSRVNASVVGSEDRRGLTLLYPTHFSLTGGEEDSSGHRQRRQQRRQRPSA